MFVTHPPFAATPCCRENPASGRGSPFCRKNNTDITFERGRSRSHEGGVTAFCFSWISRRYAKLITAPNKCIVFFLECAGKSRIFALWILVFRKQLLRWRSFTTHKRFLITKYFLDTVTELFFPLPKDFFPCHKNFSYFRKKKIVVARLRYRYVKEK